MNLIFIIFVDVDWWQYFYNNQFVVQVVQIDFVRGVGNVDRNDWYISCDSCMKCVGFKWQQIVFLVMCIFREYLDRNMVFFKMVNYCCNGVMCFGVVIMVN